MSFTLNGKTALITGAGRGIGRSIALALSASGAQVMVNDLDVGVLEETATMVRSQGGRAEAVAGDLTQPGTPDALVRTTLDRLGSLDIIVNNAGYTWDNVIQKTTDEQFQAMLDIHVVAPFRILRAASGWIRERAKQETAAGVRVMRKVVNITSISGTDGNAGQAGYSSGKSAIVGLTKTMAKEWGRYNVNVNAVGFGIIETRLTQVMQPGGTFIDVGGRQIAAGVQPKVYEVIKTACPLGRPGTPEEAAGAVLFFCSPLSDYVTGEVLLCCGGLHF